ncbi:phage portal protein [Saccharothrix saharensis]|uniref:phage portal protein n=1 Tax=Saccharothrix saharensis TaxID=571190 RepID=UPI0036B76DB3
MSIWGWIGRLAGIPDAPPSAVTFSESAPMPIDRMFLEMRGGGAFPSATRAEALSVPAVQKGRNLLCSIATLPLVQKGPDNRLVRNPLLEQIDPDVPNVVTLAQTVEDLVFDAVAWWQIIGFGFDGYPVQARRLDPSTVSLEPPGDRSPAPLPSGIDPREAVVWVDGKPVSASEVIRFDSPNPAVLKVCGRAIKRAVLFDQTARLYADNPRPLDYFTPVDSTDPASDEEILDILRTWEDARRRQATGYVPAALEYHSVDVPTPHDLQLVELQRQVTLELANALGVDPEDLGVSTTSRTYANAVDRRRDRINDVLAPYMRAITDRLSMGDVTRRGYHVVFDLDDYLKSNPTERFAVYEKGLALGVWTVDDIRRKEGEPPMSAPAPAPEVAPASVDASDPTAITFDDQTRLTFADASTVEFAVDRESRTIEGLALPYGKVGTKYGYKFRFRKGSLVWSDASRVKLLRDHDFRQALGVATAITDTAAGLKVKFKVARGPEGDRALELAEDGVLDGLSVGVDFDFTADTEQSSRDKSVLDVVRADLREVSLTPMPAFDDARVTRVAASLTGGTMDDETATSGQGPVTASATATPQTPEATAAFSAEQITELRTALGLPEPQAESRPVVNPTRLTASATVSEALPYRFDRGGNFVTTEHVFSADLHEMAQHGDSFGQSEAGKRVMGLLRAAFTVESGDVNELSPTVNRPDMYVDQKTYRTPLWNFVNKGAPPNGVQPFMFPKYSSSSGLVGDHTEGVEPTSGTFVTTNQTVTPSALSGKASITREVWDMGGNPAVSTLIFNQMVRGWREGLESATATFLNTLTAATDITLAAGSADEVLAAAWDAALADLQFVRGYDFEAFALEKELYKKFVAAADADGRKLYSQINPTNANGTAARRFVTLDLGGVTGVPSWALPSTAGSPNNSWLFDPATVHGWASTPQRLQFPGTDSSGGYAPVAMVDIAIWGYKAFANTDIGGVRQVIYDTTA